MSQDDRAKTKERIVVATVGYGTAVLLVLLGLFAGVGAAPQRYLFDGALICAASFTGVLLSSFLRRRR
jgi:hypothetical protein